MELIDVTKTFADITALQNLSYSFEEGKTTAIIGHSGCGKSTILRIIIGLTQPTSGTVLVRGTKLTKRNIMELRHKIGYLIQDGGLFPHLNVFDNISLMPKFLNWDKKKIEKRVEELLTLTNFQENRLRLFPIELSGGEKQRVSLMRALITDPEILLFDEPLAALDPMIRSNLQKDLKIIFRKLKKTVIWVTHDIGEAGYLGDTIVLLKDGTIVQSGDIIQLLKSPKNTFVTNFINAQWSHLKTIMSELR